MPAERFFSPQDLKQGSLVQIQDEEFHHLAHVMRLKAGESVELINGQGFLAQGQIQSLSKQSASILIQEVDFSPPPEQEIILGIAYPRLPRLEYALEKAIELGISEFWLFPGDLSEKRELSPSQFQRLHHIAISSTKQCGRLFLPTISLKPPIRFWEPFSFPAFFGDTRKEAPPLAMQEPLKKAFIAVGPEKGFHPREIFFLENHLQAKGVSLSRNILRADTAAIAAACLAMKI